MSILEPEIGIYIVKITQGEFDVRTLSNQDQDQPSWWVFEMCLYL